MFESLTKYLPQLTEGQHYGEWVIDRESKGTLDDPIDAPFVDYGETVTDIENAVYSFVDGHSEFELADYNDILEKNGLFGGFCGRDSGIGPAQRAKTTIWN